MSRNHSVDVAIVGGGIAGLSQAWMASQQGLSVAVFERQRRPLGASVRNFGMIWPIGQTAGSQFEMAMRSRRLWLELRDQAGIWVHECGSLHLLRHADECDVVDEFLELDPRTSDLSLLTAQEVSQRSPAARMDGLLAALWSPFELCVQPFDAVATLMDWLESKREITLKRQTNVCQIQNNELLTGTGESWSAETIMVCSGDDFETLFPKQYSEMPLVRCKLQMLATPPQPKSWKLGPHLAGGLTLRHYSAFENCQSLQSLKDRVRQQDPRLDLWGIHVMASQNQLGQIILGDSHVYGEAITPFDSESINELILDELRKLMDFPDFSIDQRWHGVYAKREPSGDHVYEVQPGTYIVTGFGGAGMTMALGVAEQFWQNQTQQRVI